MRIFIAGATGVIGRRVVPLLLAAGHQITAVGRTPEKRAVLERMGAAAVWGTCNGQRTVSQGGFRRSA